jgi:Tfp pilus assembly protein PilO
MTPKIQNWLTVFVILIGIALVWWGDVGGFKALQEKQLTVRQADKEVQLFQELLTKEAVIFQNFDQIQSKADKIFRAIPAQFHLGDTLETVRSLAKTSGLIVENIQITSQTPGQKVAEPEAEKSSLRTAKIELGLRGSYEGLRALVKAIEINLPLIDVQSLGVQAGGLEPGSARQLQLNLELSTYFLKE